MKGRLRRPPGGDVSALAGGDRVYESCYGLRGKPFSIVPDPECLFLGRSHRSALAVLTHSACERSGFTLITGPVGTGKTTLVRRLAAGQPRGLAVGFVPNPHHSFGPLVGRALLAFGVEAPDGQPLRMIDQFQLLMEDLARAGRRALLIVDEAQVLDATRLDELRMLSNAVVEDRMPHMILAGQPGLRDTLRCTELGQLAQRLVADCELQPLEGEETRQYIAYRLQHAGGSQAPIFTDEACAAVHLYAGGIPRLINILCEDALIFGAIGGLPQIEAVTIHALAADRRRGGVLPLSHDGGRLAMSPGEAIAAARAAAA